MTWLRVLASRVAGWFRQRRHDDEFDDEVRFHLAMETDANLERGMSPIEARRTARVRLGGVEQVKERWRDAKRVSLIDRLSREARQAVYAVRRAPTVAVTVVVTLAIALGGTAAVLTAVDVLVWRPVPYPDVERIVGLNSAFPQSAFVRFGPKGAEIRPAFADSAAFTAFTALGVVYSGALTLGARSPARIRSASVNERFFDVLGVAPALGRTIEKDDVSQPVVVLAHGLWRRRFASDRNVLGRELVLNDRRFTVVGVMPPGVRFPDAVDLWIPDGVEEQVTSGVRTPSVIGRLAPGVSLTHATTEVQALPWLSEFRDTVELVPLRELLGGGVRLPFVFAAAAAIVVLLVGGFNLATLLLPRLATREREFAVRRALGASRADLVRQILAEGLLLAGLAGALAILVAGWALGAIRTMVPATVAGVAEMTLGGRTLVMMVALALLGGLAVGLGPACWVGAARSAGVVQSGTGVTTRPFWQRSLRLMIVTEIACSLVLVAVSVTIVQTVARGMATDLGVRVRRRLRLRGGAATGDLDSRDRTNGFHTQLEADLNALPFVQAAGGTEWVPGDFRTRGRTTQLALGGGWQGMTLERLPDGRTRAVVPQGRENGWQLCATPGYFRALGIDLMPDARSTPSMGATKVRRWS